MLRLTEVNPKDPFDPFSLGFPGKDLLDVLIREQAAETIMAEKNTSAEARQIVRESSENSIVLYSAMFGDVLLQAQCISPLRNMANIMLQAYEQIGAINGGSIDQDTIKMCHIYAEEYQKALSKSLQHR